MGLNEEWVRVVFSHEVGEDDVCPVCGGDYNECPCPGPTQYDWVYRVFDGVLYAKRPVEIKNGGGICGGCGEPFSPTWFGELCCGDKEP